MTYEIKNLKNYKFKDNIGIYTMKGLGLYASGKGFVTLDNKMPYTPIGGRLALESIIKSGFVEEPNYIQPINKRKKEQ